MPDDSHPIEALALRGVAFEALVRAGCTMPVVLVEHARGRLRFIDERTVITTDRSGQPLFGRHGEYLGIGELIAEFRRTFPAAFPRTRPQ